MCVCVEVEVEVEVEIEIEVEVFVCLRGAWPAICAHNFAACLMRRIKMKKENN